jgi:hypothetical protein
MSMQKDICLHHNNKLIRVLKFRIRTGKKNKKIMLLLKYNLEKENNPNFRVRLY